MANAPAPNSQRFAVCVSCGYSLDGLAPQGICPECGGRYNTDDDLILRGSSVMAFVTGVALLIAGMVVAFGTLVSQYAYMFAPLAAVFPLMIALALLGAGVFIVVGLPFGGGNRHGPQLLLSHDSIRFRRAGFDSLKFRWIDVLDVKCSRFGLFDFHFLTFRVASIAFRPRFFWRCDRDEALAVVTAIRRRIDNRRTVIPIKGNDTDVN